MNESTAAADPLSASTGGSLLVVSGPPGAGKSTVAAVIADRTTPSALIEGDAFFRFLRNGMIEPWRVEARPQNIAITRIQAAAAGRYREAGYETVYDGVVGPWFLETFVEHVGEFDYALLLPPVMTCLDRIAARRGHEFDDVTATRSLHDQFSETCDAELRHHLFDTSIGNAGEIADRIDTARRAGRLRWPQST